MSFRIAVATVLSDKKEGRPPIILIHGAANSAKVWTFWQQELAAYGWTSHAVDLRGHGQSSQVDLSHARMNDYAADVRSLLKELSRPPVLMGWSMGGLIGMMVASEGLAVACIALAPSTPAQRVNASVRLRSGEFGPEEYGITSNDLEDQPAMPDLDPEERAIALASPSRESRLARDERRAGILIESLSCPLLIVTGTADSAWPRERYEDLWLAAEFCTVEGVSHWGLVLNRRALATMVPTVLQWLTAKL